MSGRRLPIARWLLVAVASLGCAHRAPTTPKTLVAVFAHPDDEILVGPLLAAEAREGTRVQLILVTAGGNGTARTAIPAGTELARVRTEEARCSARALGIDPPIVLGFEDGQLGRFARPAPAHLDSIAGALAREFARLGPDAIVTFGPEGADGHPDHRLVSAVVSQLVQAGPAGGPALFYAGFPADRVSGDLGSGAPWLPTDTAFLTTRIPYLPADIAATRAALRCHQTQIPPDEIDADVQWYEAAFRGTVYLRPWRGEAGRPGGLFR
ncbi:MAG TPA: PIG-L family deacetylase [Gemmatimonadales bacterium]|nr:PIG-L family deacetylase [Gemmatimonadales bacterium]